MDIHEGREDMDEGVTIKYIDIIKDMHNRIVAMRQISKIVAA